MPALRLEDFADGASPEEQAEAALLSEEARLAAYDQGYAAGWEDAAAAQAEDQARLRSDLANNLQALSFTYHEARLHVLRALAPLLEEMVARLLPEVAREALGPVVLDALMPLAEGLASTPVTIVLNPAARPALEPLLQSAPSLPVILEDEPTLGEGQVYLRLDAAETQIDLNRAVARITAAVRGFLDLSVTERRHG
jgi:flagellar assembly protein FliH